MAIVPLPLNVSIGNLPSPDNIVIDAFDKALQNNMEQSSSRYFGYIAECYINFPKESIIGDGNTSGNMENCNVL